MFSQVLHNSVYSFSAILTTFLIALALGATLSHFLCRMNLAPVATLSVLLSLSGVLVALSPLLFYQLTGGLRHVAAALKSGCGFVHPSDLSDGFAAGFNEGFHVRWDV